MTPQDFIAQWGAPGGVPGPGYHLNEEQGAQSHFLDLCALLDVPKPGSRAGYRFEEKSAIVGGKTGYADVFMQGVFAWENKAPGKNLDSALKQLLSYSLALSNPPILVVCDRLTLRIHTQFTGHPSTTHALRIDELEQPDKRALLRRIWTEPESFKPRQTNRDITEAAARSFATLAESLRARCPTGTPPAVHAQQAAHFLTQCLFCFFAEDVGLLPARMFERLVGHAHSTPERLTQGLAQLFGAMQQGGLFGVDDIPWFNGGLFQSIAVPPLAAPDLAELRRAAELDWSAIDPSIFGTLFERGLDPAKRSQLGAHYTDPDTIERLLAPVIRRPLLQKWELVAQQIQALAAKITKKGDKHYRAAHQLFIGWLQTLKDYRALDPACGSGNFLYLALRCLKDVELHSHLQAAELGLEREQDLVTGPHNVLGIELNEYAAELARVTVWIGELQWRLAHGYPFKTNPVLDTLQHIECRDALLAPEGQGQAAWPRADVVVGNPPFLGDKKMRAELGDAYTTALRQTYAGRVPGGADLVCYWFERARTHINAGQLQRAGLVTTNSIRGGANRKVLDAITDATRIFEAWSDEPWVNNGAAVRVSLVAFGKSDQAAALDGIAMGAIYSDLTGGNDHDTLLDLSRAVALNAPGTTFIGTQKGGAFDISGEIARAWLRQPNPHGQSNATVLAPWINGLDITRRPNGLWIVDFNDLSADHAVMFEAPWLHCENHVKTSRLNNREGRTGEQWWKLQRTRPEMKAALQPLERFIATARVAKYRLFVWQPSAVIPDSQVVVIARADDTTFGILHSRFHELWALRLGTSLEDRPRYTPTTCFETFPFPTGLTPADTAHQRTETLACGAVIPADLSEQKTAAAPDQQALPATKIIATDIAQAAQRLHQLRQRWLNPPEWTDTVPEVVPLGLAASPYPDRTVAKPGFEKELAQRTLTKLYNQRPAWLAAAHQQLDAAVAAAYGWADYQPDMKDDELLRRLLALNLALNLAHSA
ncbi:class I SAM-dependent DNA methyltransferase [Acidovorax sp. HDW3]|uniref:class I SAM-dependent DNA methyltransferase n=1 Tax=Acidovorax sp. HDW3 TaxID=2714923 RepID=UPI001408F880|nr:DNA methyltransferase [Acidovorax sp. HDW3]QIL43415.1 class I SAM-dependent DNA methyltransferase [Acidovorax sp. HDW3]